MKQILNFNDFLLEKKWIQDLVPHPLRKKLQRELNVPTGEKIPVGKINKAIRDLKKKENKTHEEKIYLKQLLRAKHLKKINK